MESEYCRQHTVKVDCHMVPHRLDILEVHNNIALVFYLPEDDVLQIELQHFYHAINIEVTNEEQVNRMLEIAGKTVPFTFNWHKYQLPISMAVDDITILTVATLPRKFQTKTLQDFFS